MKSLLMSLAMFLCCYPVSALQHDPKVKMFFSDKKIFEIDCRLKAERIKKNGCLIWAVYKNNLREIKRLIALDADVNIQIGSHCNVIDDDTIEGKTPPIWAWALFQSSCIRCVDELLMQKGLKLVNETRNSEGHTPFMVATQMDYGRGMKLLYDNGADINARNKEGYNALWYAIWGGHDEAIQFLLACEEIDLNVPGGDDKTVLNYAVEHGQEQVVTWLIESPQWKTVTQEVKNRALLGAVRLRYAHIIPLLINAGAKYAPETASVEPTTPQRTSGFLSMGKIYECFGEISFTDCGSSSASSSDVELESPIVV
jgi:hypothetical protein